jgi:hypothetical protein
VHSLAGQHLQELDNLAGSERQMQEEVIKVAMGSIYQGTVKHHNHESRTSNLRDLFSASLDTVLLLDI